MDQTGSNWSLNYGDDEIASNREGAGGGEPPNLLEAPVVAAASLTNLNNEIGSNINAIDKLLADAIDDSAVNNLPNNSHNF